MSFNPQDFDAVAVAETFGDVLNALIDASPGSLMVWKPLAGCAFTRLDLDRERNRFPADADGHPVSADGRRILALAHVATPLLHAILEIVELSTDAETHDVRIGMMSWPKEPRNLTTPIFQQLESVFRDPSILPELPEGTMNELRDMARSCFDRLGRMQIGQVIEDLRPRSWNPDEDHLWASPIRCQRLSDRDFIRKAPGLNGALKEMGRGGDYLGLYCFEIGTWSILLFLFMNRAANRMAYICGVDSRNLSPDQMRERIAADPGPRWTANFIDLVLWGIPWRMLMKRSSTMVIDDVGTHARRKP